MSDREYCITVLQRGWMAVGERVQRGDHVTLHRGAIIGRWGTDQGCGQLAGGPRGQTQIFPLSETRWHALTEVFRYAVSERAWAPAIAVARARGEDGYLTFQGALEGGE